MQAGRYVQACIQVQSDGKCHAFLNGKPHGLRRDIRKKGGARAHVTLKNTNYS